MEGGLLRMLLKRGMGEPGTQVFGPQANPRSPTAHTPLFALAPHLSHACVTQASGEIMRLLQSEAGPSCPFEKGGLDEYFLDVTALAVRSLVVGVDWCFLQ